VEAAHRTTDELLAGLDRVRAAPPDAGVLELAACRPVPGERRLLDVAELDRVQGLVGDGWQARGSRHTPDGSAEPGRQLTVMSTRAIALFAGDRARWALAGDQLYIDLDISEDNLQPGTQLRLGSAVIEVSVEPHTGCAKFLERFGRDAARLVHSQEGRRLRLRGLNARVIVTGRAPVGEVVTKVVTKLTDATAPEGPPRART
jgi:MOSC domain-containing protein YiiM